METASGACDARVPPVVAEMASLLASTLRTTLTALPPTRLFLICGAVQDTLPAIRRTLAPKCGHHISVATSAAARGAFRITRACALVDPREEIRVGDAFDPPSGIAADRLKGSRKEAARQGRDHGRTTAPTRPNTFGLRRPTPIRRPPRPERPTGAYKPSGRTTWTA